MRLSFICLGALLGLSTLQAAETATPVERLKVAKNFKVELLYSVPRNQEGSWVSMCTDPKGRLIVSDQSGGLFRVTPPAVGQSGTTKVEKIPVDIGEAQGLLWAFDSLYVVVNKGRKYNSGFYRVTDTNNDDTLDKLETLRLFDGGGEHGPHAVLLTPDGKNLIVVAGNQTRMTELNESRVPRVWSEDHLLPRMPDGNGFMKGVLAPGGFIVKTDKDGKHWELLSMGFRNQYDAAYNLNGDLFTFDADMEWDMNTPWYRPTRVCHVVSGSEFGWRNGAGKWPAYYPDSVPAAVNIGPGSPTGITFGYGAKFPAKYQKSLFIADWSYGKLYAVHLEEDGASYGGNYEEFITGTPLPLTDLVVNNDGAVYFAIGGRNTQSALYRVTYTGNESTAPVKSLSSKFKAERALRAKLESYHGKKDPEAVSFAWKHLGNKDRFIRYAARVAIEHQDPTTWQDKALKEKDPETAMNALIALARVGDKALQPQILDALNRIEWKKLSDYQKLEYLRAYSLAFTRMGPPSESNRQAAIKIFQPVFPDGSREVNAELAQMIVYLEAPQAARKVVDMLVKSPTQEEQIDFARALRVLKTGWTPELRKSYFSWFLKAANYKGGSSFANFMKNIKSDAIANLSPEEKTQLQAIIDAVPPKVHPLETIKARPFVKNWSVADLGPALEKGLKNRNFENGRQLFGSTGCFACHRFGNEGGSFGPDLTGVAGRFSPRDLLESIVEPNKTISDQYGSVSIKRKMPNGEIDQVVGRIVNLAGENVMVNPNMFDPNETVNINRASIISIEESKVSMMPEGLIDGLKEEEVLDLMAYLLSRGDRKAKVFSQR